MNTSAAPLIVNQLPITSPVILEAQVEAFYYGRCLALSQVQLPIYAHQVTAFIGPSGCGKSTLLRCFNRLNDLIDGVRLEGRITFHGQDIYAQSIDAVALRRHIGMVFQRPNPFPKSIYDNIAFGARINGYCGNLDDLVEQTLCQVALWDEVKDKLDAKGSSLSGGQQQRLCIARAIALQPEVLLMDEPCSALDPIATLKIEDLIRTLKKQFTIVVVTHNLQQAKRVSDWTAFFNVESSTDGLIGRLIEHQPTASMFNHPVQTSTTNYISGQFG